MAEDIEPASMLSYTGDERDNERSDWAALNRFASNDEKRMVFPLEDEASLLRPGEPEMTADGRFAICFPRPEPT